LDTYDQNVGANPTTLIAVPASHEKAESQSTTRVGTAFTGLNTPVLLVGLYVSQSPEVSTKDSKTAKLFNFVIFM
jgi:hypothetical protein